MPEVSPSRRNVLVTSTAMGALSLLPAHLVIAADSAVRPFHIEFPEQALVKIPVAVSAFPDEIYAAPKSWAEKAYVNLIHYNKLPKGGHFAAWEQPAEFTAELRDSFRSLRKSA